MEPISAAFTMFGIAALVASWVTLLINASKEDFTWGLCTALLPPFSYLYGLFRMDIAKESIFLAVVGCILVWAGIS